MTAAFQLTWLSRLITVAWRVAASAQAQNASRGLESNEPVWAGAVPTVAEANSLCIHAIHSLCAILSFSSIDSRCGFCLVGSQLCGVIYKL